MKKILSLLLIICSIGVAYADDKSTVTSLKYVTDELNTRQDKFGANDGKAMTFTNTAGGNLPRDVKASLGTSTSDNGLPTVSAVNTGLENKQDEIGAANTNTVVTYTGTPGTLGQKGIYQDTGTYASQSNNLIQASTFNAALRNGLNNEFVCAGTDDGTPNGNCWLWSIDNATNETITVHGKNLLDKSEFAKHLHWQIITSRNAIEYDLNSNWGTSDWIKVTPGQAYTFSTQSNRAGAALFLTDEYGKTSGLVVSGIVPTTAGGTNTYTIPAGYNYIIIQTNPQYFDVDVQIEKGSAATEYEPYVGEETVNVYIPQNQTAQNP